MVEKECFFAHRLAIGHTYIVNRLVGAFGKDKVSREG